MALPETKVENTKDVLGKPREHVPNPVPEVEEVKAAPTSTKKLKVEKVFVNNTMLVKDGGKDHIVSIPLNRVLPAVGDTVEIKFVGDKGREVLSFVKPKAEPAKS